MTICCFEKTALEELRPWVNRHLDQLIHPIDSWQEDRLLEADLYAIRMNAGTVGYSAVQGDMLYFFHVSDAHHAKAPDILEELVAKLGIRRVLVMTQDQRLTTLMGEWHYEKEMSACWFTECGKQDWCRNQPSTSAALRFRRALPEDSGLIRDVTGEFFNEVNGGYENLEQRLAAGVLFVMEDGEDLLGCGIIEKSQLMSHVASIGMFVNPRFRQKGVARHLLMQLRNWCHENSLMPVAGCWYYNTLSRKSLESAGMRCSAIGYDAVLKKKEKPPLRTGNPPGEMVMEGETL